MNRALDVGGICLNRTIIRQPNKRLSRKVEANLRAGSGHRRLQLCQIPAVTIDMVHALFTACLTEKADLLRWQGKTRSPTPHLTPP